MYRQPLPKWARHNFGTQARGSMASRANSFHTDQNPFRPGSRNRRKTVEKSREGPFEQTALAL